MTRCIAILTLALTAALSADEAFAADVTQDTYIIKNSEPERGGTNLYQQNELEFSSGLYWFDGQPCIWNDITFNCHATPDAVARDLDTLIAIIAIEHGPGVAYGTLRDMGFTEAESLDILGWPVTEGMVLDGWSHEVISPR
ncbi:MAG: hypothetical protein ABGZ17_17485 [Planctomycetaceae bacterium]